MTLSAKLSSFQIEGLRSGGGIFADIRDNTLILVGENGSGKTTFLRMMFYFLSGRWSNLTQFSFDRISATIDGTVYTISHRDVVSLTSSIDDATMRRLPAGARRRVTELLDLGRYVEADSLVSNYLGASRYAHVSQQELFHYQNENSARLIEVQERLSASLGAQILYLPTYRRIERELSSIIQGYDADDTRRGSPYVKQQEDANDYVELVEFGMNDVKRAINSALEEVRNFQLAGVTQLSLSYLGDVVSQSYKSADRHDIENASDETIEAVLNRVDETILSTHNKSRLREIILSSRYTANVPSEHEQIIFHYFTKLIRFQKELQAKERGISAFCALCSTYIVDKVFTYKTGEFSLKVSSKSTGEDVPISELSSGEKQIVSLFSHLYLSGRDKFFVLIDEPELSLSVPWQRRFLTDIRGASFCSGLVAVTHSPFIYDNELRANTHALGEFVRGSDWGNLA
jgi:ABC-type transport system involved in cytochrome c biogenesis ATPase subunit